MVTHDGEHGCGVSAIADCAFIISYVETVGIPVVVPGIITEHSRVDGCRASIAHYFLYTGYEPFFVLVIVVVAIGQMDISTYDIDMRVIVFYN